jgi:hypothetical protein
MFSSGRKLLSSLVQRNEKTTHYTGFDVAAVVAYCSAMMVGALVVVDVRMEEKLNKLEKNLLEGIHAQLEKVGVEMNGRKKGKADKLREGDVEG